MSLHLAKIRMLLSFNVKEESQTIPSNAEFGQWSVKIAGGKTKPPTTGQLCLGNSKCARFNLNIYASGSFKH